MQLTLIAAEAVVQIHDLVLNPAELKGMAGNKSIEAVMARVENRLAYGLIGDAYDLAATYAVVISRGHVFNDANKRTAYTIMELCLFQNDIQLDLDVIAAADKIIQVAQGMVDEIELAKWLRQHSLK